CFIYGFAPAFEMEAFLSDRLVLLFNVRQRIFFGSSVGHFHTVVAAGFKYIFN
uniref:conjugal transfer protein TraO n=1 Tax=Bacteroides caecimuris TaxID=1796613 RepID=UPI0026590C6D